MLTIRKGARVGLTTVQLMLADVAARRGESVGVYSPSMTMARELARLYVAEVAPPSMVAKATTLSVEYDAGGRVVFLWSVAKAFRLYSFDACYGDEWASLPPDMQHEGSPGALLRGRVRSAANPRVAVSASPSATGDALLAQEAEAKLHLEWLMACPGCGAWNSPRLDRIEPEGLACTGCGVRSPQESWTEGRYQVPGGEHVEGGVLCGSDGEPAAWPESTALVVRGAAG